MNNKTVSNGESSSKKSYSKKLKTTGLFMAILPLAACGGGGGGGGEQPAPGNNNPPPPPPPPTPDFTENPTNVFIARDNAGRTLSEGSNSANLTVTGGTGADNITTGSGADTISALAGNDTINSGGGNDLIRAGEGVDNVNAGAGDDAIVLVGTTTANQYDNSDITNPAGSGNDLSSLISIADLNGRTVSEVAAGEVIDGGSGTNTLYIYGTVDLTGVTLNNVTVLVVNSDVTLTPEQIAQFTTVNGDGTSVINIEIPAGSTDNYILDLSAMDTSNIASINIDGDITVEIDDATDLSGIGAITSGAGDTLTVEVTGNGGDTTVNLGDIADVIETADTIEVAEDVTLEIDDAADITNLGITEISGTGDIDTGGNSTIEDVLEDNVDISDIPNAAPVASDDTSETDENTQITIDVLSNDTDADGHQLTIANAAIANGAGTVSIVNNQIIYNPNGNYPDLNVGEKETITIEYEISDGLGGTDAATVTVTVDGKINEVNGIPGHNDTLDGTASHEHFDGGDGVDTVTYSASTEGVTVNLNTGEGSGGDAEGDRYSNIEEVVGSAHNDILIGGDRADDLNGSTGQDIFRGGPGADVIETGTGGGNIVVMVGTTTANQFTQNDIDAPPSSGSVNLSSVLTLDELNGNTVSDVAISDTIYGSTDDSLYLYGAVDLTVVTVLSVDHLVVIGDTKLRADQLAEFSSVKGGVGAHLTITAPEESTEYVIDLSEIDINGFDQIHVEGNVTFKIDTIDDLAGISRISAETGSAIELIIDHENPSNIMTLEQVIDVFDQVYVHEFTGTYLGSYMIYTDRGNFQEDADSSTIADFMANNPGFAHVRLYGDQSGNDVFQVDLSNADLTGISILTLSDNGREELTLVQENMSTWNGSVLWLDAGSNDIVNTDFQDVPMSYSFISAGIGLITAFDSGDGFILGLSAETARNSGFVVPDNFTETEPNVFDPADPNATISIFSDENSTEDLTVNGLVGVRNYIQTGDGDDIINLNSNNLNRGAGAGGAGNDVINGGSASDQLYGGDGDDTLIGGDGDDRLYGDFGADTIDGGDDNTGDQVNYRYSNEGIRIDLATADGDASGGHAEGDTITNVENVLGSEFDDIIYGDDQNNELNAYRGLNNEVHGRGGNDVLDGAGRLYGGSGDDYATAQIVNGLENHYFDGGTGTDRATITSGNTNENIEASNINFENIEILTLYFTVQQSGHVFNINEQDVINLTDENNTLYLRSAFDSSAEFLTITTSSDWSYLGTEEAASNISAVGVDGTYHHFRIGDVDLYINANIPALTGFPLTGTNFTETSENNFDAPDDKDGYFIDPENTNDLTLDLNQHDSYVESGVGDDLIYAGTGKEKINGGDGIDHVDYVKAASNSGESISTGININLQTNVNTGGAADGDEFYNIEMISGTIFDDTFVGSDGDDTFSGSLGDDVFRGGLGADTIYGMDENDTFVIVGTTTAGQYNQADITNPAGTGFDLSSVITLDDLNGRTQSEAAAGEVINGGSGINTLYIYGTVDLTGVTLHNITSLVVNSDVTMSFDQLGQFTSITGDGSSILNIEMPNDSNNYIIDLSTIDTANIAQLHVDGDVTFKIDEATDLANISRISADVGSKIYLDIDHQLPKEIMPLDDIAAVFDQAIVIDHEGDSYENYIIYNERGNFEADATNGLVKEIIDDHSDLLMEISLYGEQTGTTPWVLDLSGYDFTGIRSFSLSENGREEITINKQNIEDWDDDGSHFYSISVFGGANDVINSDATDLEYDRSSALDAGMYHTYWDGNKTQFRIDHEVAVNSGFDDPSDFTESSPNTFTSSGTAENSVLNVETSTEDLTVIGRQATNTYIETGSGDDHITLDTAISSNYVITGAGDDTVIGSDGRDLMRGKEGNDTLLGGDGRDTLYGGAGADYLDGGAGDEDQLNYYRSPEGININLSTNSASGGHAEGDTILNIERVIGTAFDDIIIGDEKNNRLTGDGGNDMIYGGAGDDELHGKGELYGETGEDFIRINQRDGTSNLLFDGGADEDRVVIDSYNGSGNFSNWDISLSDFDFKNIEIIQLSGGNQNDGISLSLTAQDVIDATDDDNILYLSNWFHKDDGSEISISTDSGWSFIDDVEFLIEDQYNSSNYTYHHFQNGDAHIYVDIHFDNISGLPTPLTNFNEVDTNEYEAQDDKFGYFRGGENTSDLIITADDDLVEITTGSGNDTITTGQEVTDNGDRNIISSGDGDDIVTASGIIEGGAGADTMTGVGNNNTLSYKNSTSGITINLKTGTGSGGDAAGDTFTGFHDLIATDYDDHITSSKYFSFIDGGKGNDTIIGSSADDHLVGGEGQDHYDGGDHDGDGDTITFWRSDGDITVNLSLGTGSGGSAEGDTYINIENIDGIHDYVNHLTGNNENNILRGGSAVDTLIGLGGDDKFWLNNEGDIIDGGSGYDTLESSFWAGFVEDFDLSLQNSTNIEAITSQGSGINIIFTAQDIIDLTDANNTLYFTLDDNDTFVNSDTWTYNGIETGTNGAFYSYTTLTGDNTTVTLNISIDQAERLGFDVLSTNNFTETSTREWEADDNSDSVYIKIPDTNPHTITGKDGNDLIIVTDQYNDVIRGGAGDDVIIGNDGQEQFYGGLGADFMDGRGGGNDSVYYNDSPEGVNVNLLTGLGTGGYAEGDILLNIRRIEGSEHDDTFVTTNIGNTIHGYGGNDTITGGNWNDILFGGDGNDIIDGGIGSDEIYGDAGDDTIRFSYLNDPNTGSINGGDDTDTLLLIGDDSNAHEFDLSQINVSNIEELELSDSTAIKLTLQDLLDATTNGSDQLIINGDNDNAVTSTGEGWVQGSNQVIDGETYHTYTSGAGTLLIDEDINQTIS